MTRLTDWERRLNAYLSEPGRDRFEWGHNDCALFTCGAILAMTGEHPFPEFVGAYDDRDTAAEALRVLGAGTLFRTFDTAFPRLDSVSFARRGDAVMAQNALGICMGGVAIFLTEEAGFTRLPMAQWQHGWRV